LTLPQLLGAIAAIDKQQAEIEKARSR